MPFGSPREQQNIHPTKLPQATSIIRPTTIRIKLKIMVTEASGGISEGSLEGEIDNQ